MHLTVNEPFGEWKRGDHITDPAAVAKALETHPSHVAPWHPHEVHASGDFYLPHGNLAREQAITAAANLREVHGDDSADRSQEAVPAGAAPDH